jgi:energy-coupling factor transporter ATP-binding protein EcfA2
MAVLDEILAWSELLGDSWVRDALRRIVTQPEITDADIGELGELCKKPHGLSAGKPQAVPLAAAHLPVAQEKGPVYLASLTHVSDVNALAPGESVKFGKTGLTVVYGDNGAGKSGYSRILKRACRARGSGEPLLPNALSDQAAGTPTAKLSVGVGGAETDHTWKEGGAAAPDLGAVSVFDALAAQVYISDKTEARFRPFGLDVLDKLAAVCARVKARLDEERAKLHTQTFGWPPIPPGTEAGQLTANLTALTKQSDVDRLSAISASERDEMENLAAALAAAKLVDPEKRALDLRTKAGRVRRLASEMRALSGQYDAKSLGEPARLARAADTATRAAEQAAKQFGGESLLPGLETPEWREMWEAGRAYSEAHAYPGRSFPHVETGAKCAFCQQDMDAPARTRLAKLEELVRGKAQAEAKMKRGAADDALKAYAAVPGERFKDAIDDLASLDAAAHPKVLAFIEAARAARTAVLAGREAQAPAFAVDLAALEKLAVSLDARATEMQQAADPAKRADSERRLAELKARETLAGIREKVLEEIDRKGRINAYDQCVKATGTNAVTKLSGELTKKHVTDALTKSFSDELARLGFTTLELEVKTAGAQRGVMYHQVQFKYATRADLSKIVSEGEGRCVALAAFLAEVRCAPHSSAIVFDDPVSSLDHRWRQNVARRLVEEATVRQVIVFTHELVFLHALLTEAEKQGVPHATQTVRRSRKDMLAGHVEEDLPWDGLSTKRRIGVLRTLWQAAEKVHRTQEEAEYSRHVAYLYGRLRQTWERALEEVLLGDVVQRFRQSIETQRLKNLDDITKEDLKAVEDGMGKSSEWEGGHDHALAINKPLPEPAEIKMDIDALEMWVTAIRKRRS